MNAAVADLPSSDGRKVRGPTARFTIATTPRRAVSRLMTLTARHDGKGFDIGIDGIVRTMNALTGGSWSAMESGPAPGLGPWPARRAMGPWRASVTPATMNTT